MIAVSAKSSSLMYSVGPGSDLVDRSPFDMSNCSHKCQSGNCRSCGLKRIHADKPTSYAKSRRLSEYCISIHIYLGVRCGFAEMDPCCTIDSMPRLPRWHGRVIVIHMQTVGSQATEAS